MAAPVNSDRRLRRKRGSIWGWFARRFGALVVTIAALASVIWISPLLSRGAIPTATPPAPRTRLEADFAPKADEAMVKPFDKPGWIDAAQTPGRRAAGRRGVSLNAAQIARGDGFEVLNAAELDAISQAH